ncbi:unnamed protein product (macronuclear) [Paramecium tetraurelia]|uniref:Ras-related protein Rab-1 n=1 Tax=Paramecium tetraurelia TaxID=5888 RepID=Q3SDM2_PARTE|nr:uncharacterized protein GSPATT00025879001 [Paramecium tetraurelia]CAI39336.1 rab_B42 [Paramecium tetraurelia]CAK93535.1 unnamed protein product [Paramecium tetraurelia]|eukprot:XP_001460932.1 hypothetical protein (macronuclear) [Paramecium tetraurelia strain d4-2]
MNTCDKPIIKLLIIGDSAVGKTNILKRFCENQYTQSFVSTIGIDFKFRDLEVEGKLMRLQIWDTAGQERFRTITSTYFKGAMGVILVYAVNNLESFQNIQNWMNQVKQNACESVIVVLVANKSDLNDRVVQYEQGKNLADSYGIKFFETSAKEGINIIDTFQCISKQIKDIMSLEEKVQNIKLEQTSQQAKSNFCC